jgi:hypothetical protein
MKIWLRYVQSVSTVKGIMMNLKVKGLNWNAEKVKINNGADDIGNLKKEDPLEDAAIFKLGDFDDFKATEDDENDYNIDDGDGGTIKIKDNAKIVQERLAEKGIDGLYKVVVANDNTIQVDLDEETSCDIFRQNYNVIKGIIGPHKLIKSLSKSKRLHVTIKTTKSIKPIERIAIQAFLGSDPLREALNYRNTKTKQKNPILFIESKED